MKILEISDEEMHLLRIDGHVTIKDGDNFVLVVN